MALRLLLLGGARLEADGRPVTGAPAQPRRLAVLALLARSPRRTLTRERVLAYLWPEHAPEAGRRLLSEAIYVLRRDLGESVIAAVGDTITLGASLECDVDELCAAAAAGDHDRVAALYTGPFLDAWFVRDAPELERWAEAERVELKDLYMKSLRLRTEQLEAAGEWHQAADGWQRIARLDPYRSTEVMNAARAYVAAGERATALVLLREHMSFLREEFGPYVDTELVALERSIGEGRLQPPRTSPARTRTESATAAPSEGVPAPAPPAPEQVIENVAAPRASSDAGHWWSVATPLWRVGISAVAMSMVLVLAAWLATNVRRPSEAPLSARSDSGDALDPRHIAVLYFDDQSPNHALRHVADGMAEELIRELADVPTLQVLSRDATSRVGTSAPPFDSIGRALHAGTIISGTLRESAGRIRVTARIVDAVTGIQTATVSVEQPRSELFALEDSLATRTAAALRQRLGDVVHLREERRIASEGGRNDQALEQVLRAERLRKDVETARTTTRLDTSDLPMMRMQLRTADSMLENAESIDPSWSRPSIERGWVAETGGRIEHGTARVVTLASGLGHAERALTLLGEHSAGDSSALAGALYLRGILRVRTATAVQTFRPEAKTLDEGERDLRRAVRIDSTLAGAWAGLSLSRWLRGDFDAALDAARHALAADAFLANADEVLGWAWRSAYFLTDRDGAMRWCERGRTILPKDWHFIECELTIARLDAARLTRRQPDPERAWALVRDLERVDPDARAASMGRPYSPIYRQLVAAAITAASGQQDSARRVLGRALTRAGTDQELATDALYDAAFVECALGDTTNARKMLASYLRARPDLTALVARDPTMRAATPVAARMSTASTR